MPSVKSYQNRKAEIAKLKIEKAALESELQFERGRANLLSEMANGLIERTISARKQIKGLETRNRIFETYVRYAYPDLTEAIPQEELQEIPACLKPLDAIKYSGERINNGPNNLSQQLP